MQVAHNHIQSLQANGLSRRAAIWSLFGNLTLVRVILGTTKNLALLNRIFFSVQNDNEKVKNVFG